MRAHPHLLLQDFTMRCFGTALVAVGFMVALASPVLAQDEGDELWFNPAYETALDDRTAIELETAQRLRSDPRDDTYFARLWLKREDSRGRDWNVGVEHRWNGPDEREVRLLQQVGYDWGRSSSEHGWSSGSSISTPRPAGGYARGSARPCLSPRMKTDGP